MNGNGIKKKNGVDFEAVRVASNSDDDDGEDGNEKTEDMGYQQTLMYGRYSRSLAEDIKEEAKRQKLVEKLRQKELKKRHIQAELKIQNSFVRKMSLASLWLWRRTFARLGEDWVFLAILGLIMALVSFAMDYTIALCNNARLWLAQDLVDNVYLQFVAWVCLNNYNNNK